MSLNDLHTFNINCNTREIFLHGYISDTWEDVEVDHRMANTFLKNMSALENENHKPILIHQCTCGGDWNYGLAIYDRIKASPCYVTVLAYAHARSMSSIIPLAADRKIIMPNATYMIHHGSTVLSGETQTVISDAKQCELETEQMLDIYIEVCKNSEFFKKWTHKCIKNWLLNKIKVDWYLSARESVKYGFMDAVFGDSGFETMFKLRN